MKELNKQIEILRAEMVDMIAKHGALSPQAIEASEELDKLIAKVQKMKK